MYWIYLIVFVLIVFVPHYVSQPLLNLSKEGSQELVLLALGTIGFCIFLVKERFGENYFKEKSRLQSEMNRMMGDLRHSYSYIGEVNRKLEIVKNAIMHFPEEFQKSVIKKEDLFASICEAIRVFGGSKYFIIRFVDVINNSVIEDIRIATANDSSGGEFPKELNNAISAIAGRQLMNNISENDQCIFVSSPRIINGLSAQIVIAKHSGSNKIENPEILKALAVQALFLYTSAMKKASVRQKAAKKQKQWSFSETTK